MLDDNFDYTRVEMPECSHNNAYLSGYIDANSQEHFVFWACVVCGEIGEEFLINQPNSKEDLT